MGGDNTSSGNPFRAEQAMQGGEEDTLASTAASATRLYARLCETQEASLRQALADKEAALTRLQDHETMVKELVQAMDNAIKDKETLQSELDARCQTQAQAIDNDTDAPALAQAIAAADAAQAQIAGLEGQLETLTAEMHAARAETLRLKQALATTKEDVAGLTRWNRQEMKDRRETEQENEGLRERVAQMSRRLRRVAERAREGPEGQHRETSADTNPTGATPGVTNSTIAAATTIINPAVQQRQQERQQGRQQERQEQRQQERREQRQQDRRQQQQEPLLQAKVADLEDELQMARCLRESLETAVADTTGQLRTALGRLTGLEALVQAHEAGRNLVDEAQEEVERLELANHDLSREVMGLEALLEEARQAAESEKRQLAMMKVGMEEAMVKAQASVDEIIQLKMAEADLMGQVTHLEAERAQDQARISLMQEERDAWRKRAEEEVSEWVGVLAEGGADADREGKPDEEAAAAAAAEAVVDAADAAEVEAAATTTTTTGTPAVATINTPLSPPDREELGGLDPLEALMGENLALRAQIEGLRRREAEMQLV